MSDWSPARIPRSLIGAIGFLFVLWAAFAIIVTGQIFLSFVSLAVICVLYLGFRVLVAFEAIADAGQRLADQYERNGE